MFASIADVSISAACARGEYWVQISYGTDQHATTGVIVQSLDEKQNPFFHTALDGVCALLATAGYTVTRTNCPYSGWGLSVSWFNTTMCLGDAQPAYDTIGGFITASTARHLSLVELRRRASLYLLQFQYQLYDCKNSMTPGAVLHKVDLFYFSNMPTDDHLVVSHFPKSYAKYFAKYFCELGIKVFFFTAEKKNKIEMYICTDGMAPEESDEMKYSDAVKYELD